MPNLQKYLEQNMLLYAVFIDFSKAVDTVSTEKFWQVLLKFDCPEKFINLIVFCHNGTQAYVTFRNSQ